MVFRCEAPDCRSDNRKKPDRYPWMSSVRWVKWPKHPRDSSRWRRLLMLGARLSGGDGDKGLNRINRRTRLCSRHFDPESITAKGTATADPRYFAWNNWGMSLNSQSSGTADGTVAGNDQNKVEYSQPCTSVQLLNVGNGYVVPSGSVIVFVVPSPSTDCITSDTVPEVGSEIVISAPSSREDSVGKLKKLTPGICQPAEYEYLQASAPKLLNNSTQTNLTSDDFEDLLKIKATASKMMTEPTATHFAEMATETDKRLQFYVGMDSSDLLRRNNRKCKVAVKIVKRYSLWCDALT